MSQKMPSPLMTEGGVVAATRICPVCGEASYSRQGIHPQCAVTQADATRTARLKAAAKKRDKSAAHKPSNSFTLSAWHKRCPRCRTQVHIRKLTCTCGHTFDERK